MQATRDHSHETITFMGYRLAQIALLLSGLVFAFAALDVFTEPWRLMNEGFVAETICGHLIALVLSILCFRSALQFEKKVTDDSSQIGEPTV